MGWVTEACFADWVRRYIARLKRGQPASDTAPHPYSLQYRDGYSAMAIGPTTGIATDHATVR
jgi:hypothetical protein